MPNILKTTQKHERETVSQIRCRPQVDKDKLPAFPQLRYLKFFTFAPGEMAERSNAAVLKTVDCNRSGGSNPSLSASLS